jgi:general secretion pathway protein C
MIYYHLIKFSGIAFFLQRRASMVRGFGFYRERVVSDLFISIKNTALKILTPKWLLCVVMLMVCYQLAVLIRQLWLPVEHSVVNFTKLQAQSTSLSSNKVNIEQFNLFGAASSSSDNMDEDTESLLRKAPLSTLEISVTGIVASSISANSIAIIAKDGKQFSLGIGDNIPGYSAKIVAIFAEYVVINHQGRNESLLLGSAEVTATKMPEYKKYPGEEASVAQYARQPKDILDCFTLSPVMLENKLDGYRLSPGTHSQLFYQVGLRDNDLAVAINGLDLRDTQQARHIMEQLSELKELKITVERNGQLHDVFIAVGDV